MSNPSSTGARRLIRTLLIAASTLVVALLGLATAGPASADTGSGWLRLAHLSPDTPEVNVSLTSFSNSKSELKLTDVGYGSVSAYQKVPAGRYVATMTPAKGGANTAPAISQAVDVENGRAYTVAAVGDNAHLKGRVISDDLRTPAAGSAKVRLLQASIAAPTTTVTAVQGPVLAKDAAFGSVTGYATIGAGVWTVQIAPTSGTAKTTTTKVTATPGSVNTIILLDNASGQVTAKVIKDAAAAPKAPKKSTGVDTGFGGTATDVIATPMTAVPASTTSAAGLAAGVLALVLVGFGARRLAVRRAAAGRGERGSTR